MSRKISRRDVLKSTAVGMAAMSIPLDAFVLADANKEIGDFVKPHDDARPWVYWFFMDGNLTREGDAHDTQENHDHP